MYKDLAKVELELEDVEEDETTNGYDELVTGGFSLTHPHPRNQKEDETDFFCEDREGNRPDEEAKQSRDNGKKYQVVPCEKRKRWRKKVCWLCAAAKTDEGFDLHCCAGCRKARYCGLSCHEEDWERHKEFCQQVRKWRRKSSKAGKREKIGEKREG